jgi:hypothetical protein
MVSCVITMYNHYLGKGAALDSLVQDQASLVRIDADELRPSKHTTSTVASFLPLARDPRTPSSWPLNYFLLPTPYSLLPTQCSLNGPAS